jgi:hypothetical protein
MFVVNFNSKYMRVAPRFRYTDYLDIEIKFSKDDIRSAILSEKEKKYPSLDKCLSVFIKRYNKIKTRDGSLSCIINDKALQDYILYRIKELIHENDIYIVYAEREYEDPCFTRTILAISYNRMYIQNLLQMKSMMNFLLYLRLMKNIF